MKSCRWHLAHDVHPVESNIIRGQHWLLRIVHVRRWRNRGLRHGQAGDAPLELSLLEEGITLLLDAVRNANEDAVGVEHAVDLRKHLLGVGACTFTA